MKDHARGGEFDTAVDPHWPAYTAVNTSEAFPGPMTPLSLELSREGMRAMGIKAVHQLRLNGELRQAVLEEQTGSFGHRIYANLSVLFATSAIARRPLANESKSGTEKLASAGLSLAAYQLAVATEHAAKPKPPSSAAGRPLPRLAAQSRARTTRAGKAADRTKSWSPNRSTWGGRRSSPTPRSWRANSRFLALLAQRPAAVSCVLDTWSRSTARRVLLEASNNRPKERRAMKHSYENWQTAAVTVLSHWVNVYGGRDTGWGCESAPALLLQESTVTTHRWQEHNDGAVRERSRDEHHTRRTRVVFARIVGVELVPACDADDYHTSMPEEHYTTWLASQGQ